MTPAIGVEPECGLTAGMLRKVVYAGCQSASFAQAAKDIAALAEVSLTVKRIERWTKRIGEQRVEDSNAFARAYQELPIPSRQSSPQDQVPQVACVQMDGGRIQIRERIPREEAEPGATHWRETLVGSLFSMISEEHASDPCPKLPWTFADCQRMSELSREIKGFAAFDEECIESECDAFDERAGRPVPLVKSVVATNQGVDAFATHLIAAAHARGFNAATRKAFIADGSATNWGVHRKHFSHYTPIVDFTHAICYVWAAAMAGRDRADGWRDYQQWSQWLWSGEVDKVIQSVETLSNELGPPDENEGDTSPRKIVASTLTYLRNQRSRMRYDQYRKRGLPITSSYIESTIKQINRRVKGTEKFWDQGAAPMLQLVADHLSETSELEQFWKTRPTKLRDTRSYQSAA